jgi:hypothetical protein
VRALRVVMMPALAIETVCCSLVGIIWVRDGSARGETKVFYHDFVQYATRRFRHLVKLVNAAYAPITQNECTAAKRNEVQQTDAASSWGGVNSTSQAQAVSNRDHA